MKTYIYDNKEAVIEYLENLSDSELVQAHNTYCQNAGYGDNEIFDNDEEFFETHFSKAHDAIRAAFYGEYEYGHDYVTFNGYANLDSFNNPEGHVDLQEIANDILESPRDYDVELEEEEDEE